MFDRVDFGGGGDRRALALRVRGDLLAALVHDLDCWRELVNCERHLIAGATGIDRDLHEVRAGVHLGDRRGAKLGTRVDEHHERREFVPTRDPGPGRDDVWCVDAAADGVADAQVEAPRRAHVARGEHTHPCEVARGLISPRQEVGVGIAEPRDPVSAAQSGEVRMAVDQAGNDRGA